MDGRMGGGRDGGGRRASSATATASFSNPFSTANKESCHSHTSTYQRSSQPFPQRQCRQIHQPRRERCLWWESDADSPCVLRLHVLVPATILSAIQTTGSHPDIVNIIHSNCRCCLAISCVFPG